MQQRVSIITLGVNDLERARNFYKNLGWSEAKASNENICFFQLNSMVLSLYPRDLLAKDISIQNETQANFGGITLAYNVASEQEVQDVIDLAKKSGAKIIKRPEKAFWGGFSGYFQDAEGHYWEVAHNPYAQLDEDGNFRIS